MRDGLSVEVVAGGTCVAIKLNVALKAGMWESNQRIARLRQLWGS